MTTPIFQYILCLALSALLLLSPFAVDHHMLYPTQFGQLFFSLKTTLLITILLVVLLPFTKHSFLWTDCLLFISVLFVSIQAYVVYDHQPPFNLFTFFIPVITYAGFRYSKSTWTGYLFTSLLIAGLAEALYGNIQLYGLLPSYNGFFKMTGTFFNPAPFAGYLAMVLPAIAGCWLYRHDFNNHPVLQRILPFFAPICAIAIIAVLPTARSRASWFAAIIACVYLVLTYPIVLNQVRSKLVGRNWYMWIIIPAAVIAIALLLSYQIRKDSANGRLLIWKVSAGLFLQHPITGAGFDKFKTDYMPQQAAYLSSSKAGGGEQQLADNVQYAYNELIHIGLESGIVGLLLLTAILYFAFVPRVAGNTSRKYVYIARSGLLSLLTFSFFSYPADILPMLIIASFYLAVTARYTASVQAIFHRAIALPRLAGIGIAVATIIAAGYIWNNTLKSEQAFRSWGTAHWHYQQGDYAGSLPYYIAAAPSMLCNGQFLNHYGKALFMTGNYQQSVNVLQQSMRYAKDTYTWLTLGDDYKALDSVHLAEVCYQQATAMAPTHLYPRYCLANMYYHNQQYDKALATANALLRMPVKVTSAATDQIRKEMQQLIIRLNQQTSLK